MALVLDISMAMVVLVAAIQACRGAVYKVGDSAGWTTIGNVDYKLWSATKSFKVGDVIKFEYSPQFHNVMRVAHAMYKTCNASLPIESYTTGNDSITITTRGHHFFLCGVPGHCQSGQKVDINVPHVSAASIAPTPSALVSPSANSVAKTPSPSSDSNAAVAAMKNHGLALLALQAALLFVGLGFSSILA